MNTLYFKYIEYRIRRMDAEQACLYLANSKLSKAQQMQLLMNMGLSKAEAESAYLTAKSTRCIVADYL